MRWETRTPIDLVIAIGATLALLATILLAPDSPIRIIIGIPFAVFLPGYVTLALLFPGHRTGPPRVDLRTALLDPGSSEVGPGARRPVPSLDFVERLILSLGVSIALVPLMGLLVNFTPTGITLWTVVAPVSVFVLVTASLAYVVRLRTPVQLRPLFAVDLTPPPWKTMSLVQRGAVVGVIVGIVMAGTVLGSVLSAPPPALGHTEFFVLGPGGSATDYPSRLNVSDNGSAVANITVVVVSHEAGSTHYSLELLDFKGSVFDGNVTIGMPGKLLRTEQMTLESGQAWSSNLSLPLDMGLHRLQMNLHLTGQPEPYRQLHLWVEVGPPKANLS